MKVIITSVFLFLLAAVMAQGITVSGNITDSETGEALIGVTIVEKGTNNGTITDLDGNYNIMVSGSNAILVFSYIGYGTQEIPVDSQTDINVLMEVDYLNLEEVVVVGYGTQKSRDLTSAISIVPAEEITKTPTGQTMQALQGKVAGVQIVSAGSPGAEATVRIRGIGSYSNTSPPLYVVNGAFYSNIDFVNPSEIETITILKDASASAIYGVRAANGVVIITTKGGEFNTKPTITYDGYYGVQVATNVLKMANAAQFVEYVNQTGSAADQSYIDNAMQLWGRSRVNPNVPDVNTDWYKEIMRTSSPKFNHALSVSGGSENSSYSFGVSYYGEEGLLRMENSYERMNITTKLDQKLNNWLNTGVNFNYSNAERYLGETGSWFQAYHAVPILPTTDDANYDRVQASGIDTLNIGSNLASARQAGYRGSQNPLITMNFNNNRQDIKKVQAGVYGEVTLIPNQLKFKTNYNVATMFLKTRNFDEPYLITDDTYRNVSSLSSGRILAVDQYWDNNLTYTKDIGDHSFSLMAGTSFRDEYYNWMNGSVDGVPLDENNWYINSNLAEDYTETRNINEGGSRYYGLSYLGRVSYNYKNRYLGYFTLRRDGSHKYQEKWGTFPAFGLGWIISDENFLSGVDIIDFLKIKAGWGKLGTDVGAREDGANTVNQVIFAINDQPVTGTYSTSTFGYLGWEVVVGTNIGFTADLLDSRLSVDADYYVRDTENAIIPVSLKLQAGAIQKNTGGIRNSGFELTMDWNDNLSEDLRYTVGMNFATLKNEVTDLYGQEYLNAGQAEFRQRSEVGHPLFSFYGYETAGVYQDQSEIDGDPVAVANGLVPGDLKFKDQNNDDIIDDDDKVYLGTYFPNVTYGAYIGLDYKGLSFSMNIMGQSGNKIINRKRGEIIWTNDTNIDADLAENLWNGPGTSNTYPSASGLRRGWNQNFSDYIVEEGSFFRIQNVRVMYTFDKGRFFSDMPQTSIYFTADKPLTSFVYNGFSPEVPNGVDRQYYPIPATYSLGINLKL